MLARTSRQVRTYGRLLVAHFSILPVKRPYVPHKGYKIVAPNLSSPYSRPRRSPTVTSVTLASEPQTAAPVVPSSIQAAPTGFKQFELCPEVQLAVDGINISQPTEIQVGNRCKQAGSSLCFEQLKAQLATEAKGSAIWRVKPVI